MSKIGKYIKVTADASKAIARAFDVSDKFVYMALYFRTHSDTAVRIRYVAVKEYKGELVLVAPSNRIFVESDETENLILVRESPAGSKIMWYPVTGDVLVEKGGKTIFKANHPPITELCSIFSEAEEYCW